MLHTIILLHQLHNVLAAGWHEHCNAFVGPTDFCVDTGLGTVCGLVYKDCEGNWLTLSVLCTSQLVV